MTTWTINGVEYDNEKDAKRSGATANKIVTITIYNDHWQVIEIIEETFETIWNEN